MKLICGIPHIQVRCKECGSKIWVADRSRKRFELFTAICGDCSYKPPKPWLDHTETFYRHQKQYEGRKYS